MGVKWLTSYVKSVERLVSSQDTFAVGEGQEAPRAGPTFVVDAWAFIYHVWLSHFGDAMRGLDYQAYQAVVLAIIDAWRLAGITTVFVFDGPFLPAKLPKILERRGGVAASNTAFIKSSPASRTSRRFQIECGIIAPLLLHATIDALSKMKSKPVEMVFAPTEADSLVAEIATEKESGYAVSLDSDYFILCARGKGCPYVPLDAIEYLVTMPPSQKTVKEAVVSSDDLDGFEEVGKRKRGAGRKDNRLPLKASPAASQQSRTSPPITGSEEELQSVRVRAYRSQDLASHLQIPPSLLPLLAGLVGNDYTTSVQSTLLFRNTQGPQRVAEAASILRNEWVRVRSESKMGLREATKGTTSMRKGPSRLQMTMSSASDAFDDGKSDSFSSPSSATATPTRSTPGPHRSSTLTPPSAQDPVRAMVRVIVDDALLQADAGSVNPRYIATGEKDLIMESVIESAATYSLLTNSDAPHHASPSALFFGHPSSLLTSDTCETVASLEAVEHYRQAYTQGVFKEALIEAMTQRVFLSTLSTEDLDVKSVQTTAARELRSWLWAVLFEVWGMSWARDDWEEPESEQEEDEVEQSEAVSRSKFIAIDKAYKEGEKPDDVISVDTESSNSVTMGDGEDETMDELPSRPGSVVELRLAIAKPAPGVVEYVRKGHQLVGDLVQIFPLLSLLNGSLDEAAEAKVELPASLAQLRGQHEACRERPQGIKESEPASDPIPPAIALMPLTVRLDLYLHAHRSNLVVVQSLPRSSWPIVAALRLSIQHEAARLGPAKRKLNWSKRELMAAVQAAAKVNGNERGASSATANEDIREVQPSTRAIHLASTLQLLFETSYLLAQALLLPIDVTTWPRPHALYHGPTFHASLLRVTPASPGDVADGLPAEQKAVFAAVVSGLDDDLGIDASELRRERKAKKKDAKSQATGEPSQANKAHSRARQAGRNAFALLGDAGS